MIARRQRPAAVRPIDRPQQQQDRPDPPHDPRHVPRQQRPRREERQHPRGVDVGEERAGRVVRIAAVEPDPDAGPVRASVRTGRLATADHARREEREGHRDEDDRDEVRRRSRRPRGLATERPSVDTGPAPRRGAEQSAQPTTTSRRAPGRAGTGRSSGGGWASAIAPAFSHGGFVRRRTAAAAEGDRPRSTGPGILSRTDNGEPVTPVSDGTVIIIGGAEDKVRDRVILSRFVALAGGRDATIAVISTASSLGPEAGERYKQVLGELGVSKVRTDPRRHPRPGQRRHRAPARARRDRHLPDRRQPAAPVLDDRRHAPGRRGPRAVPPGRGRRRHERGRVRHVQPHGRVRGVRRDAEAPDGPDRGGPRGAARVSSSTSTSSSGTASVGCSASSPRTRACSGSASTRTRPASSGPTTSWRSSGAARSPSSTAPAPRPTPGRSTATGR